MQLLGNTKAVFACLISMLGVSHVLYQLTVGIATHVIYMPTYCWCVKLSPDSCRSQSGTNTHYRAIVLTE